MLVINGTVVVGRIEIGREIPLDEISRFIRSEPEENVQLIDSDISRVQSNGVVGFRPSHRVTRYCRTLTGLGGGIELKRGKQVNIAELTFIE